MNINQPRGINMFKPTNEQQVIVDYAMTGKDVVVQAYAGCGKTSTMVLVAKALQTQGKKGIYLAFNKDIATEAKAKMPSNVNCLTVHSLAYRNTDKKLIEKLKLSNIYPNKLAEKYGIDEVTIVVKPPADDVEDKKVSPTQILTMAKNTVKSYCNSSDETLDESHVEIFDLGKTDIVGGLRELERIVLKYARIYWNDIIDPKSIIPLTHDAYLKLYSMSNSKLNVDFLICDENQDSDPCTLAIINRQDCQKILVGDTYQSIYQWRGAINAMDEFNCKKLHLTKTFRFGKQTSAFANNVLKYCGARKKLVDNGESFIKFDKPHYDCYIYRTNQGALECYLGLVSDGLRPHLNVNVDEIKQFVQHFFGLEKGWDIKRPHPLLTGFKSIKSVREYLADNDDKDLAKFVSLCDKNGYELVYKLDNMPSKENSDCIVMTAHKSKGLEFDSVYIGDDFNLVYEHNKRLYITDSEMELNLTYVAITRAMKYVNCTNLRQFFNVLQDEIKTPFEVVYE